MDEIIKQIEAYKQEINAFAATDADHLEQFRIRFLGVKGIVKAIMGEMKNVSVEEKKSFGQILNAFKILAEEKFESEKTRIESTQTSSSVKIDTSLPGLPISSGSRHPVTLMRNRIVEIFEIGRAHV